MVTIHPSHRIIDSSMSQEAFTFIDGGAAGNQMINKKELTESFPRGNVGRLEVFSRDFPWKLIWHSWKIQHFFLLRDTSTQMVDGNHCYCCFGIKWDPFWGDQRMQVHGHFFGGFPHLGVTDVSRKICRWTLYIDEHAYIEETVFHRGRIT